MIRYLFAPFIALIIFTGCQTMPSDPGDSGGDTNTRPPAPRAEQRELGFVIEDLGSVDGQIELWLRNDSSDMPDDGDWYPGKAAMVDEGWVTVQTGFLVEDGDPISVNGRYKLQGDSKDHWLVEFIYGVPYSHIVLGSVQADDEAQDAEIVDNGHRDSEGYTTGVDARFTFQE